MTTPFIPESAPFSSDQRAWLNGFFAAILSGKVEGGPTAVAGPAPPPSPPVEEDFPWHDAALPLAERLRLADGKPYPRKLMAAMAQLDCGACGYVCQSYSEAIARGEENDLTKCSPGGMETAKALKQIVMTAAAEPATEMPPAAGSPAVAKPSPAPDEAAAPAFNRNHPFVARLVSSTRLTHPEAPKDTRHVVIDLLDSGLTYEPGDSLGILPQNPHDLVAAILELLDKTGGETVCLASGKRTSLRHALTSEYTLGRCRPDLFTLLAAHADDPSEKQTLEELTQSDANPLLTADLAEVLERFPSARPPLERLLESLARLQPRLYSICSSQRAHPTEVHLTVGVVRFESLGRWKSGIASNFLGVRSLPGDEVRVFVQRSPKFRLPAESGTPVIMIGPGTGIAPFRAFLEEREALGAAGKSWLFFGNQHFEYDFLYKQELSRFLDSGALTKLDLAFSRDGAEKVYVQHRLVEQGAEVWRWIEEGAHLYICGDARHMAVDVEQALLTVAAQHGKLSPEEAKQYLSALAKAKRYHKDVY